MIPSTDRPTRIVAFLLDVSAARSLQENLENASAIERYTEKLITAVRRLLNYHKACSECDLQWCYQIFDTDSCYLSLASRTISTLAPSQAAIDTFREELSRRLSKVSSGNAKPFKDKYAATTRALADALRDVDWDPRSDTFSYDSLLEDDEDQTTKDPVYCENGHSTTPLLYLFSAAPDSIQDLTACEGAIKCLPASEGDACDGRETTDASSEVDRLLSSTTDKPGAPDEFTKTVSALAKRDVTLVWVDSKSTLTGIKSAERTKVISAFDAWLSSIPSVARLVDIHSLLLDERILPSAELVAQIHGEDRKRGDKMDSQTKSHGNHALQWCRTDVLTKKPSMHATRSPVPPSGTNLSPNHGASPKQGSNSPSSEVSTASWMRYFRANLSSRLKQESDRSALEKRNNALLTSSDHAVIILRQLIPYSCINDEELFNMGAFDASAHLLRPISHDDGQSDIHDVRLWTALFAGLMESLFQTRRSLLADVCVPGPGDSGHLQTHCTVLIRPMTVLSASVREVHPKTEVPKMHVVDTIEDISVLGDRPGSLTIPDMPSSRNMKEIPEDHFDHYLGGQQDYKALSESEQEHGDQVPSIRKCLQNLVTDSEQSPSLSRHSPLPRVNLKAAKCSTFHDSVHGSDRSLHDSPETERKSPFGGVHSCSGGSQHGGQAPHCSDKCASVEGDARTKGKSGLTSSLGKGFGPDHSYEVDPCVNTYPPATSESTLQMRGLTPPPTNPTDPLPSPSTLVHGEPVKNAASDPSGVTALAPSTQKGQPGTPSTLLDSPSPHNILVSPITDRPEIIPPSREEVYTVRELANRTTELTAAIESFASNLAKLSGQDDKVDSSVSTCLQDLEKMVRFMSDKSRFVHVKEELIEQHLRNDDDVLLDLQTAQTQHRAAENCTTTSKVIGSKLWLSVLAAFAQVVWQIARFAFDKQHKPKSDLPQGLLRSFAHRSTSVLSCTQMMSEVTASSPRAHDLFHKTLSAFLEKILCHYLKGNGVRGVGKLVRKIFTILDVESLGASPCFSAGSKEQHRGLPVAAEHDTQQGKVLCKSQSSYKKLCVVDSENTRSHDTNQPHALRGSSSGTSTPAKSTRRLAFESTHRVPKRSVQRALQFDSDGSPEKRAAETQVDMTRTAKRQKKLPSKDCKDLIAKERERKSAFFARRRSQPSNNTVELRTTKRKYPIEVEVARGKSDKDYSLGEGSGQKPEKKSKLSNDTHQTNAGGQSGTPEGALKRVKKKVRKDPDICIKTRSAEQEPRRDKLLVIPARFAVRRSPRNKNVRASTGCSIQREPAEQTDPPKRRISPRHARNGTSISPPSRSRRTSIASHRIVPATPIRKKRSSKEAGLDWKSNLVGRVTRGKVQKLADVHQQGGIPQSP